MMMGDKGGFFKIPLAGLVVHASASRVSKVAGSLVKNVRLVSFLRGKLCGDTCAPTFRACPKSINFEKFLLFLSSTQKLKTTGGLNC
jgi:hypothetical protein